MNFVAVNCFRMFLMLGGENTKQDELDARHHREN